MLFLEAVEIMVIDPADDREYFSENVAIGEFEISSIQKATPSTWEEPLTEMAH